MSSAFLVTFIGRSPAALLSQDLFRQTGSYETHGQILKAKQTYNQILNERQSDPSDPLVLRSQVRMARLSVPQGDIKAADSVYHAAMKLTPEQIQKDPELMIDIVATDEELADTSRYRRRFTILTFWPDLFLGMSASRSFFSERFLKKGQRFAYLQVIDIIPDFSQEVTDCFEDDIINSLAAAEAGCMVGSG